MSRGRDALLEAVLPGIRRPADFWSRFGASAPLHLRLALRLASGVVGWAPLLMGHGRTLRHLDAERRDAVVQRLARGGLTAELLEVAKVVACLAHFDDPDVQSDVRR